jgi:hypothetical protein
VADFDLPTVLHARLSATQSGEAGHIRFAVDAVQQDRRVSTFELTVRPAA